MGLTSFRGQHRRWDANRGPGPSCGVAGCVSPRRGCGEPPSSAGRTSQRADAGGRTGHGRTLRPHEQNGRATRDRTNPCVLDSNPSGLTTFHARIGRRTPVRGLSFGRCTIPLEARRLGMTASTSDLSPSRSSSRRRSSRSRRGSPTCRLSSPMRAPRAVGPSRAACLHGSRPTPGAAPPAPPHRVPAGFLRGAADCGILIVAGPGHPRSQTGMVQPTRENDQRGAYAWTRRSS